MDSLSFFHTKQSYQLENINKSTYDSKSKYLDLGSSIEYGQSNNIVSSIMNKKNMNNKSNYQSAFNYDQQNIRNIHCSNKNKLRETDINKEFIIDTKPPKNKPEDYMFGRLSKKKQITMNELKNDLETKISEKNFMEEDSNKFQSILTTVKAIHINGNEKSSENLSQKRCNLQKVSNSSKSLENSKLPLFLKSKKCHTSIQMSQNSQKKTFNSTVDGVKIARGATSYLNNQSIVIRDNNNIIETQNHINSYGIHSMGNFNLPKVIHSNSSSVITSLNNIIHNENGRPITLNDNSIKRLKKLLNLDDFAIVKEKEKNSIKGKKIKNSLTKIDESQLPSSKKSDYTQIVSKVMILKKLSNKKKENSSCNNSPKSSLDSHSQTFSYNENMESRRNHQTEGSSIMKIIFTDRIYDQECTPPKCTPRQDFSHKDDL